MRPEAVGRRRVRSMRPSSVALDDVVEHGGAADGERRGDEDGDDQPPRRRAAAEEHRGENGDEEERDDSRLRRPEVIHGRHSSRIAAALRRDDRRLRRRCRRACFGAQGSRVAGRRGRVTGSPAQTRRSWPRGAAAGVAAAVVIPAAILLAGCASPSILRPEGSAGHEIRTLALWVFGILAVVLLTVWVHPRLRDRHAAGGGPRTQARRPAATCASRSSGRPSPRSS